MFHLSDTSIRLYRKQNGTVAVHLHSYMMVKTTGKGFSLSAYLNQFDCTLTLASGEHVKLNNYKYTENCLYSMDHMIYELWASGLTEMEVIKNMAGFLRIEYRIFSFPGQGNPDLIEQFVPVLARGNVSQRYSSDPNKWI